MMQILSGYTKFIDSNNNWSALSTIKNLNTLDETTINKKYCPKVMGRLAFDKDNIKSLNVSQLVKLYLETGEESFWQEFYSKVDPHLRSYISKILKSYKRVLTQEDFFSLREDLVQEVYLKLLNNQCQVLHYYKGNATNSDSSFYSYLYKVTSNLIINYFRQRSRLKRQASFETLEESFPTDLTHPKRPMSAYCYVQNNNYIEIKEMVLKAFSSCKTRCNKKIFFCFFILGMTAKEITTLSGFEDLTQSYIESVLRMCKKQVANLL